MRRALIIVAALLLATAAPAAAAVVTSPRCLSTESCSFTSCSAGFAGGGSTLYFCDCQTGAAAGCVPGSNGNLGTSAASPKQTFDAAVTALNAAAAGSQILFCKGGFHSSSGASIFNTNASAANPVMMGNYTAPWNSGGEGRPIIKATSSSVNVIDLADSGNGDHDEGYIFQGLDIRGAGTTTTQAGGGTGAFLYNDVDHVLFCDDKFFGSQIGIQVSDGNTPNAGANSINEYVTVRNCEISYNASQGMLVEGSNFDGGPGNYLHDNGWSDTDLSPDRLHNVYFNPDDLANQGGTNMSLHDSELYNSTHTTGVGICQGNSFVGHGIQDGTSLYGLLVWDGAAVGGGCYGIAIDTGYTSAESFANISITRNAIVGMALGIGGLAWSSGTISDNVILGGGIQFPDRSHDANDTLTLNNITIIGNTVVMNSGTCIQLDTYGTGHVVGNNACLHTESSGTPSCFALGLSGSAYATMDYDDCYCSSGATCKWSGGATLSSFQSSSGKAAHSLTVNPLFVTASGSTPGTFDYALQSGSSLRDTGSTSIGPATDYLGASIYNTTRDIGAYEYQGAGGSGGSGSGGAGGSGSGGAGGSPGSGGVTGSSQAPRALIYRGNF